MKKMKQFGYLFTILSYIFGIIGPLIMLGTVGALECNTISFKQFYVQVLISVILIGLAFITYDFRRCCLDNYEAAKRKKARARMRAQRTNEKEGFYSVR